MARGAARSGTGLGQTPGKSARRGVHARSELPDHDRTRILAEALASCHPGEGDMPRWETAMHINGNPENLENIHSIIPSVAEA